MVSIFFKKIVNIFNIRKKYTIKEYYFSLIKLFFVVYSYLIMYNYLLSIYKVFFQTNTFYFIEKNLVLYLMFLFFLTSIIIISIRFNPYNIIILILSLFVEYLVNRDFLVTYFTPLIYFSIDNDIKNNLFSIGFNFYLAYFIINLRENKYLIFFLFLFNFILLLFITTLIIKVNNLFFIFYYLYLIIYPLLEFRIVKILPLINKIKIKLIK